MQCIKELFNSCLNTRYHLRLSSDKRIISKLYSLDHINSGAFGDIFVSDTNKGRFAVKKINIKKVFIREKKILTKLKNKPNIINIIDSWQYKNSFYIAFKYYNKGDLFEYIEKYLPLNELEAKKIFMKIINPIKICHSLNIVHCDIKLENYVIDDHKNPVLIDFGMSIILENNEISQNKYNRLGTREYSPPEIYKNIYGKPTDIWSLGAILFILLHGYKPFNLPLEINKKLLDQDDYILNQNILDQNLSNDSIDLITKLLNLDFNKRYIIDDIFIHPWMIIKN